MVRPAQTAANEPLSCGPTFSDGRRFLIARSMVVGCFVVLMFLWPFELPIAMAAHGLTWATLGPWYGVLFHATALSLVCIALIASGRWRERWISGDLQCFSYAALLYVAIGAVALPISSAAAVETRFSFQQLLCGYMAPALAAASLLTLSPRIQSKVWTAFYLGWIAFLCTSFVFLYVSWGAASEALPNLSNMNAAERLVLWRFSLGEDWNTYGTFIGNSNKTSNYLVIFLLLSVWLLRIGTAELSRARRAILAVFWILALVTLVLLFSRAALLLIPFVIACSGIGSLVSRRVAVTTGIVIVVALVVVSIVQPVIFQYLLVARLVEDADANPLGTFVDRFEQWQALIRRLGGNPLEAIFGFGTTGYGMAFFNSGEAGTHNFLLDLWAESGVFGLFLFAAFLSLVVYQIVTGEHRARDRVVLAVALLILLLLMTREHSVSYLYVTALGGMCVVVVPYLAVVRTRIPAGV